MKIIVDTNIVFSAILNTNGKIGELLLNSVGMFEFFSCNLLREEILTHKEKLLQLSKLSEAEFEESKYQIFSRIQFISEELIPFEIWKKAIPIVRDVDMDDIAFVSLNEFLSGQLWTGDKELMKGIKAKGYTKILSTDELFNLKSEMN